MRNNLNMNGKYKKLSLNLIIFFSLSFINFSNFPSLINNFIFSESNNINIFFSEAFADNSKKKTKAEKKAEKKAKKAANKARAKAKKAANKARAKAKKTANNKKSKAKKTANNKKSKAKKAANNKLKEKSTSIVNLKENSAEKFAAETQKYYANAEKQAMKEIKNVKSISELERIEADARISFDAFSEKTTIISQQIAALKAKQVIGSSQAEIDANNNEITRLEAELQEATNGIVRATAKFKILEDNKNSISEEIAEKFAAETQKYYANAEKEAENKFKKLKTETEIAQAEADARISFDAFSDNFEIFAQQIDNLIEEKGSLFKQLKTSFTDQSVIIENQIQMINYEINRLETELQEATNGIVRATAELYIIEKYYNS